ncbi:uncharacterized protein EAF02_002510 [Botrytis sinoallii]|uniref:uncharacterized protein n=1 Tax=Botrytis sinoallii TaxID=1463999 RepID=UPI0018FF9B19|nr:uncharacterized protein EAF02_002510 [Botrytis sinoallii]KAF7890095.1 hypothetical protein EAF02_002510 [Botrytis sinoallii]
MTNTIGQGLKASASQVTWIAAAVGTWQWFFHAFLCALLSSPLGVTGPYELIVICGLLGICTAAIAPPALGILFTAYPEGRRRNMACGALGNWQSARLHFRKVFHPVSPSDAIRRFDYAGSLFIVLAVALVSAGLTEGPQSGWLSVHVVLLLVFGVFFIFGFIAWEYFYENPLLDLSVWRNGNFSLCVICMGFGYMSFITTNSGLHCTCKMFNITHHYKLLLVCASSSAGVFWSFLGQWLIQKVHGTIVMGIGSLMYSAGAILLLFIKEDTSYWLFLFPALIITVIGADFQFIVANLYANKQMPTQASLGVGIIQTAYRLSITIGLAITSAIFNTTTSKEASIEDPTFPYRRVYICSIIFASIGLACIPFMRIQTRTKDNTSTHARPTTLGAESNASMIVNHSSSQSHYDTLLRQLNLHRENPLNLDERVYRGHRAEINNAQRYDPALPRSMTMNDIAQGLLRLPRWSWENRPRAGFWRNRRGSQCHWESSSGDIFEVCKKCKEERKIKDEEGAWQEIDEAGRDCVKEGGRGKGMRAMELEIKDERRFTV